MLSPFHCFDFAEAIEITTLADELGGEEGGDELARERSVPELDAAMVERHRDLHDTRSSSAVARAITLSTLKPSFSSTVAPGAEAPKRSSESASPWSPIQRSQPRRTPGSTESRARTSGGSTSSR